MGAFTDNELVCKTCGQGANGYFHYDGTAPSDHDVCVCRYCATINMYHIVDGKVYIEKATDEELQEIKEYFPDLYNDLATITASIKAALRMNPNERGFLN